MNLQERDNNYRNIVLSRSRAALAKTQTPHAIAKIHVSNKNNAAITKYARAYKYSRASARLPMPAKVKDRSKESHYIGQGRSRAREREK